MTYDPHDANANGIIESNVSNESVTTGNLTSTVQGGSVHNLAQYSSLQAAIDAADDGDSIFVPQGFNTEDPASYLDKTLHFRGVGASVRGSTPRGSILNHNTAGSPLITATNAHGSTFQGIQFICKVDDPALVIDSAPMAEVNQCGFYTGDDTTTLLRTQGTAWRTRIRNTKLTGFAGTGLELLHDGDGTQLNNVTTTPGANMALGTPTVRCINDSELRWMGGIVTNANAEIGLQLEGVQSGLISARFNGATSEQIVLDADANGRKTQHVNIHPYFEDGGTEVVFRSCTNCHVIDPFHGSMGNMAITFEANAAFCSALLSSAALRDASITVDANSFLCGVRPLNPVMSTGQRGNITSLVEGTQIYNPDHGAVNTYDGANWKVATPLVGSYTGDGTTANAVTLDVAPDMVHITDGSNWGTVMRNGSNMALAGSMGGSISVTSTGFEVSDGGGDAFPNADTIAYDYIAF